jgi:hypothetical protein
MLKRLVLIFAAAVMAGSTLLWVACGAAEEEQTPARTPAPTRFFTPTPTPRR